MGLTCASHAALKAVVIDVTNNYVLPDSARNVPLQEGREEEMSYQVSCVRVSGLWEL